MRTLNFGNLQSKFGMGVELPERPRMTAFSNQMNDGVQESVNFKINDGEFELTYMMPIDEARWLAKTILRELGVEC